MFYFGHVSPFALFPLQKLHHYYELIRPRALHRHSDPCGASTWVSPLTSKRQVPKFPIKASILSSCPSIPTAALSVMPAHIKTHPQPSLEAWF